MQLDKNELKNACLQLAKNNMWDQNLIDLFGIKAYAEQLYNEAMLFEESIVGQDRDPNIISRAVHYLNNTLEVPMDNNIHWFKYAMTAIIELACPSIIMNQESQEILIDIEEGIAILRNKSKEMFKK